MANHKKTTLKNGLRIITVPVKGTKTVTVLVLVGTGSKYETKEINGLSHFLEHMFFKGTKKYPNTLKLIEPLDKIGGQYNAFTSQEFTGYWAKLDANHLDVALDWVADIYLNSKIEEAEINRERGTILQELNMYLDTPMSYVGDLWTNLLYGNQPAGWRVIGQEEVIKKIKRAQFIKYLREHYFSQNTIIVVAGQISHNSALAKVKKYFKSINSGSVKDKLPVKERQNKPKALVYYKKTDQTHLHLGVRSGYDIFHPDKYTLGLLSVILGRGMSSRLWISVRERQGLAYYISAGAETDTDTGYFVAQAGVDNQRVEKAIKTILKEYKKITQQKVSPTELKKAKEYTKGTTLINMESSDAQASFVAFQELLTKEILTLEEKFAKIEAVTVNDIQRVAQDIFKPEKLNLALIGPFKDKRKFEEILNI
ncbi:MAG: insulinase family protein [Candidatus Portnoybacteria bacterium]|nr:insulinase family protein [Candidatus Portnoybacteria bacterium]